MLSKTTTWIFHSFEYPMALQQQSCQKSVPNAWYIWKSKKKKYQFYVGGTYIEVTTLERNHSFFPKVNNVSRIWNGFFTGTNLGNRWKWKVFGKKKCVQNVIHLNKWKKVMISRGRCAHRSHHARTKMLLFLIGYSCILRFAWFWDT